MSFTPHEPTDWMDRERAANALLYPDKPRAAVDFDVDPYARLMQARRAFLGERERAIRAQGRVPRVCLYALAPAGHEPTRSWARMRAFADERGWQVADDRACTDPPDCGAPLARPGWICVRRSIRAAFVDGVVVLTSSVIGPCRDEYERQINWVSQHLSFVAVVAPEARR